MFLYSGAAIYVEVKPFGASLQDTQIRKYLVRWGRSTDDLRVGVLTNLREWRIYVAGSHVRTATGAPMVMVKAVVIQRRADIAMLETLMGYRHHGHFRHIRAALGESPDVLRHLMGHDPEVLTAIRKRLEECAADRIPQYERLKAMIQKILSGERLPRGHRLRRTLLRARPEGGSPSFNQRSFMKPNVDPAGTRLPHPLSSVHNPGSHRSRPLSIYHVLARMLSADSKTNDFDTVRFALKEIAPQEFQLLTRLWRMKTAALALVIFLVDGSQVFLSSDIFAFEWVPSDEEIQKYRQSWNPFSHGPLLQQSVDIMPQGQWSIRPFIFSQISEHHFDNRFRLATEHKPGPVHLYSVQDPFVSFTYGITNHLEFVAGTSLNSFWAKDSDSFNKGEGGPWKTNTGLGDTSVMLKYRPIVQDPDTWRPSITIQNEITLPTGKWFTGTESPPGGFAPLGRFPSTQFGSIGFTEGVACRKIIQPIRISCGLYYTYQLPGSDAGQNTYSPDLINTRLVVEHILSDRHGFGYNLEFVSLHGVPWRLDGHDLNRGQLHGFSTFGVEPGIQWRFGDTNLVGAAGVLFTVAGQNSLGAIYPNLSMFWYFPPKGKSVIMR